MRTATFFGAVALATISSALAFGLHRARTQDRAAERCAAACFPEPVQMCLPTRAACSTGREVEWR